MTAFEGCSYYVSTWGCQMNERDTEVIESVLGGLGMERAAEAKDADLVVLNSCCVRKKAEDKVLTRIGEICRLKKDRPNLMLAVCGCMVQQEGVSERLAKRFGGIDLVFGVHNIYRLPELLAAAAEHRGTIIEIWDEGDPQSLTAAAWKRKDYLKANINISFGCNNFCSYCIVPKVRGREKSRPAMDILEEVRFLADKGCVEIMLLGQNVNSYGKDLGEHFTFAQLLHKIADVPGIKRVRFMTSHPKDFSDELIDTIAVCETVCNHVHLPVQAGSNRILELMRRGYSREAYLDLVGRIRERIEGVSITSDIIVGFPGETEEEFKDTLDLVTGAAFDNAFTFLYSPRSGTRAEKLPDPVPAPEKRRWLQELMRVQNSISLQKNQKLVGRTIEVLIDSCERTENGKWSCSGRSKTNKIVNVKDWEGKPLTGTFQEAEILRAQTWSLSGGLNVQVGEKN